MKNNNESLTKGSQSLFGKGELLGKIKQSKDKHRIIKSNKSRDELKK